MMTAAAPAFPHVWPSVTSVLGTRDAPPHARAATCRNSVKVTIYNCRIIMAPAMNPRMWRKPVVRRNVAQLREDGFCVVNPVTGNALTTGRLDTGLVPTPEKVTAYAWQQRMRTLKAEYWDEAVASKPRTPSAVALPLLAGKGENLITEDA